MPAYRFRAHAYANQDNSEVGQRASGSTGQYGKANGGQKAGDGDKGAQNRSMAKPINTREATSAARAWTGPAPRCLPTYAILQHGHGGTTPHEQKTAGKK
jgi:hypothetical protein